MMDDRQRLEAEQLRNTLVRECRALAFDAMAAHEQHMRSPEIAYLRTEFLARKARLQYTREYLSNIRRELGETDNGNEPTMHRRYDV